ncbi:MAG TPA: DUF882 domain-containing protein [Polyangiaceae bacterium]|nr:DUF882 domain-containing protein [Polyangiaceae bacterium]
MRLSLFARPLLICAALACAAVAGAQPPTQTPQRAKRATTATSQADKLVGAAAVGYLAGKQALVGLHAASTRAIERDDAGRPMLTLTSVNRSESLCVPVSSDGAGFGSADLDRIAHLLRAGGGEEHPVDPRTVSLVYRIETHFETPEIRVVSGYRVPKPGSRSNHGKGRALDIIVPGVADEDVARFVREVGFAGVGIYPTSQFVHVDIRPRSYFWVDDSGPHMKNRERGILGDLAARSDAAALARGQAPVEPFEILTDVDGALKARGMAAGAAPVAEEDEEDDN